MKFSHFTSFPYRYALLRHLLLAMVLGSICLSSCGDDIDRSSPSSHVSFTPYISSSWNSATRSTTDTNTPQGTVTALQGGSTPLYLHTLYIDSIASPSSDFYRDTSILSRATPITSANMYDSFGISAYSYTDSWSESKTPNYFYNVTAGKSGSNYILSPPYYWPGSSYKMRFFAYAPNGNEQYVLSGSTHTGSPTISVTIPSNVADQKDLLVAKTDELVGNANTAVPLTFNHALTAIKFACGNDMQGGTVKSVSLKNVYSTGLYNMGTQSWSNVGTTATFSQILNKSTTGTPNEALNTDAQTFMMVPQTLPNGAQLEVVFTDNFNVTRTLTANIQGTDWLIGKTVTYKISTTYVYWTYILNVTQPANFTYTGGTKQYSVTSYRQSTTNAAIKEYVPWTAQYSVDNGVSWTDTPPNWLNAFTASGTGGTAAKQYDAIVSAQIGTENSAHTIALQNAPVRGSAGAPYNLANQTNGGATNENTANCYVVSAPGYYSFPLVYGNAIKNSATNSSAYTYTLPSPGSTIMSPFINHTGNGITSPYISNNASCIPATAELVWQDAPNLVTDIQYNNTGNGNISFKVNQNTIRQGNAVIAIKDASGTVLWSWHIWVTDEDISTTIEVTNFQNQKYKFMSVNLGWCDAFVITYAERSCKVKFTSGNQSKEITIKQTSNSITTGGNHPYYEWGRKDPFIPSSGLSGVSVNKTYYNKDGVPSTANTTIENFPTGITCIVNYIRKPNVMQSNYRGDNLYMNLWSANNNVYGSNGNPVIKTIYDPSPVGFKLPASNAFTGFTTTGGTVHTTSQINGIWDSSLIGWHFYTNSLKNNTIFFPGFTYRSYSNGGYAGTGTGYYWLAVPSGLSTGVMLQFGLNYLWPSNSTSRAFGFPVRSSKDE